MKILDSKTIERVQKILARQPNILAAYLFGSQVAGFANKKSDLDLAVVVQDKKRLNEFDLLELLNEVRFPRDLDISVVDRTSSPLFLFEIISGGNRIYEKNGEAAAFEARVLNSYYDTRHLRNIYKIYLKEALKKGVYGY